MFNFLLTNKLSLLLVLILTTIFISVHAQADTKKETGKKSLSKAEFIKRQTITTSQVKKDPVLVVSPETKLSKPYASHDFGEVKEGDRPKHVFQFKNSTKKNIKVLNTRVPCGCAGIQIQNKELKPEESTSFTVTLDTNKHQGPITKSFYLLTNYKEKPIIKYEMKAVIKAKPAPICHASRKIEIPPITPGETKEISFPIENTGLKELIVQYRFPSKAIKVLTKAPFIVPAKQKKNFIFEFTAGEKPKAIKDKLILITNDKRKKILPIIITGKIKQ